MTLDEVRSFLKDNIKSENKKYFGGTDDAYIDQVTSNWFNDTENYDGRWNVINSRIGAVGKVLDMAAGCGTFVLNGLQHGYDVYGVEPEAWKMEYFKKKILASNYPTQWNDRIIYAVGEVLPFEDESFDLITSYQTLEHVQDVKGCIQEMLRVLKRGGVLYIRAPDYNCFYEPHYRVPFLPKMNKALATQYLKLIGLPTLGLKTLQWTTTGSVTKFLREGIHELDIKQVNHFYSEGRKQKIKELLPRALRNPHLISLLNKAYEMRVQFKPRLQDMFMVGRREKHINLWVTKVK